MPDPRSPLAFARSLPSRRRRWWAVFGGVLALTASAAATLVAGMWDAFGARPSGERLARLERSPHYRDGQFVNTLPARSQGMSFSVLRDFLVGGSDYRRPGAPLPVVRRTAADFAASVPGLRVTWLGHSTLLVELDGVRLLVDPVWGDHAAPSPLLGVERFYAPPLPLDALPPLDAVVLSHDHYDHLDMPTIRALAGRVPRFVAPLGVGAHLEAWGVPAERIVELDWWEEVGVRGVRLVSTPARHFSGRALTDRNATLWSGWAFLGRDRRLWYSGDSALTPDFFAIGERLGPFDMTLIETGAYNAAWTDVHMGPEQAVAAHRMVRGGLLVPVHWGLFDLALHGWTEPAERVRAAARAAGIPVAFPRPGESLTPETYPADPWWPPVPWQTAAETPIISTGLPDSVLNLIPRP
ncbi:MBL fold metallo-hydrolase [Rhodocaloribacter litoris]|uniref:MBL fold metallo-hydrolase n=1 Tax=Rhodocaloribacter litoris TaxID=2558931 RepID=UPI001E4E68E7|nr:MBL fold metallo-hydrolase [Rhodocaloribacter litoris]QXD14125.1 MBL fold metallo-hydrolase [Rhodocaloribacter litoris]